MHALFSHTITGSEVCVAAIGVCIFVRSFGYALFFVGGEITGRSDKVGVIK